MISPYDLMGDTRWFQTDSVNKHILAFLSSDIGQTLPTEMNDFLDFQAVFGYPF